MNLTTIGPGLFAAGLVGLAGGLYALQRLRVRHREQVVVTTLFWREEIEEQRARTLVERFRHPLTYALCLGLAVLLWLGAARPDANRAEGTSHVLLLDGSAAMALEGRFDAARTALLVEIERCPRDRTEVLFCGADLRRVLAPGEDRALLAGRLERLVPAAVGESMTRALRAGGEDTRFVVIGDARPRAAVVEALPASARVEVLDLAGEVPDGPRIVALGVAPSASGRWGTADVFVRALGLESDGAAAAEWTLDGEPGAIGGDATSLSERTGDGLSMWRADVPLDGRTLGVSLPGNGDLRARASITLPARPPIRVALTANVPASVAAAVASDPAVEIVSTGADVTIGDVPAGAAGVAIVAAVDQEEAILVGHDAGEDSGAALSRAVGELGLDRVDGQAIAERTGRTISVGAAPSDARRVSLWSELLTEDAGFTSSRAFPVVLARAVRWAADVPPLTPYIVAGMPVPRRADEAADAPRLAVPADGTGVFELTGAAPASGLAPSAPEGPGPWRPMTWILLLALALLGAEWALHRTGRIA